MSQIDRLELQNEIRELELRLKNARSRLRETHGNVAYEESPDSALQTKALPQSTPPIPPIVAFRKFLKLSISSVSRTSLPYLLAAYRAPAELETLDNDLDASTPCTVARRASVAQGRALISVWEKSFRPSYILTGNAANQLGADPQSAVAAIEEFSEALKMSGYDNESLGPNGHFAPLWGVVCAAMGIEIGLTAYTFMLNHAKAVLSAAVRASVMGPYQAQTFLASNEIRNLINERIRHDFDTRPEDAGQVAPVLDLWLGRHELLYAGFSTHDGNMNRSCFGFVEIELITELLIHFATVHVTLHPPPANRLTTQKSSVFCRQ
uniref:Putative urease accessory protein UreF-like n=1 Tax=Talaromyces marneffei PM1 TaxID=1077442 RepID=A0A093VJJ9_TALMA